MRKSLFTLVFAITVCLSGYSQYNIDYGFSVGAANYLGDICGGEGVGKGFVSDMKLNATRWNLGGFFRYKIANKFALKASLGYVRLTADDANTPNPARRGRNLNFKNDMIELLGTMEYYIYKANDVGGSGRYNTDFNLYLFGGIGAFYSNPKGQNSITGEWVSLKPLATEGASYSSINLAVPVGIGFYYTLQRKYRLGLELGWRHTFTDYIDDVSGEYISDFDGISNKSDEDFINSITHIDGQNQPTVDTYGPGKKRGNPDNNDSYMTATVNFSWAIRGKSKFYKSRHSWVLGKKKRRRRKSRAKF